MAKAFVVGTSSASARKHLRRQQAHAPDSQKRLAVGAYSAGAYEVARGRVAATHPVAIIVRPWFHEFPAWLALLARCGEVTGLLLRLGRSVVVWGCCSSTGEAP